MTNIDQAAAAQQAAEQARATATLQQALRSPLPRIYANSFMNALTDADVMTIFQANGQSVAILNLNYTVAKTLANALLTAVAAYEDKFKVTVPEIEIGTMGGSKITTT